MELVKQVLKFFKKKYYERKLTPEGKVRLSKKVFLTEEDLIIFWTIPKYGTEEVTGIEVFGYWKGKILKEPPYPKDIWPESTQFDKSIFFDENDEDAWNMLLFSIRIFDWPKQEEWEDILKKTLVHMCNFGAIVAWCGSNEHCNDPPSLFDPKEMPSKYIYAAYSKEFGFKCTAYLGQPYKGFTDEDMLKLKTFIE